LPWLVYGFLCNLIAIYIYGFPKKVQNSNPNETQTIDETKTIKNQIMENKNNNDNTQKEDNFCKKLAIWLNRKKLGFKNFQKELKVVIKNLPFLFLCVASANEGLLLKGFLNFISLFFQYQYQLSSSTSTIITGGIAIFSVIVGSLSGAYIITKYKFNAAKCSLFVTIIYLVTSFSFWFLVISCPELSFIESSKICNDCSCSNIFDPVCLSLNNEIYEYQSACHAGCSNMISSGIYSNCSCLYSNNKVLLTNHFNATVSFNFCDKSIRCLGIMIAGCSIAFFIVFLTSIALIPHLRAIIQTVDSNKQSFALGLRLAIIRVIGNFTGPIIFGAVIDSACLIWKINCFNQKRCELYNNKQISLYLAAMGFSCRFSSCLFCFMAYLLLKNSEELELKDTKDVITKVEDKNAENIMWPQTIGLIQTRTGENKADFNNSIVQVFTVNLGKNCEQDVLFTPQIYAISVV
jgi:hypothetical protein